MPSAAATVRGGKGRRKAAENLEPSSCQNKDTPDDANDSDAGILALYTDTPAADSGSSRRSGSQSGAEERVVGEKPATTASSKKAGGETLRTSDRKKAASGGQAAQGVAELDKSKRISGQGMPRQPKTPRSRRYFSTRAISTPQV